ERRPGRAGRVGRPRSCGEVPEEREGAVPLRGRRRPREGEPIGPVDPAGGVPLDGADPPGPGPRPPDHEGAVPEGGRRGPGGAPGAGSPVRRLGSAKSNRASDSSTWSRITGR